MRKGVTQAKFNEENSKILFGEIAILSIVIGIGTRSWAWFGVTLGGMLIALAIKPLAIILMILLSLVWGTIGYGIGTMIGSTGAKVVLSTIGLMAGLGLHFSALEWTKDIGSN